MSDKQTTAPWCVLCGLPDHLREIAEMANEDDAKVLERAANEIEHLREALWRIAEWAGAYPTAVFPGLDDGYCQRAHEVLKAHGMSIDRISADAMRHALCGVGRIARGVLGDHTP